MEIEITEPQPATLYIFSDGRFEDVKDFALGNLRGANPENPEDPPIYVPIGSLEAQNLAITAFSTRRGEARPEERQAFVQVGAAYADETPYYENASWVGMRLAEILPLPMLEKQQCLEMTDAVERLRLLRERLDIREA